jgi:hypothetical protein
MDFYASVWFSDSAQHPPADPRADGNIRITACNITKPIPPKACGFLLKLPVKKMLARISVVGNHQPFVVVEIGVGQASARSVAAAEVPAVSIYALREDVYIDKQVDTDHRLTIHKRGCILKRPRAGQDAGKAEA